MWFLVGPPLANTTTSCNVDLATVLGVWRQGNTGWVVPWQHKWGDIINASKYLIWIYVQYKWNMCNSLMICSKIVPQIYIVIHVSPKYSRLQNRPMHTCIYFADHVFKFIFFNARGKPSASDSLWVFAWHNTLLRCYHICFIRVSEVWLKLKTMEKS